MVPAVSYTEKQCGVSLTGVGVGKLKRLSSERERTAKQVGEWMRRRARGWREKEGKCNGDVRSEVGRTLPLHRSHWAVGLHLSCTRTPGMFQWLLTPVHPAPPPHQPWESDLIGLDWGPGFSIWEASQLRIMWCRSVHLADVVKVWSLGWSHWHHVRTQTIIHVKKHTKKPTLFLTVNL